MLFEVSIVKAYSIKEFHFAKGIHIVFIETHGGLKASTEFQTNDPIVQGIYEQRCARTLKHDTHVGFHNTGATRG